MSAFRLYCDPLGSLFRNKLRVSLRSIFDEIDLEAASSKETCGQNFVSRSLKLTHVAEARENLARRFERVCKLVKIIGEHMERAHLTRHRSSHESLGIVRILILPKLVITMIAPPKDYMTVFERL